MFKSESMRKFITVALLLMGSVSTSFGWGQIGHRTVGLIAEWHLSKRAARQVNAILGPTTLAMVSTWMDEIRSDPAYDYTNTWHWVTVPDGQTYDPEIQEATGNAYKAVQRLVAGLKSDTLSARQEKEYLMMLVHLVGDLHQPLHVGTGTDRGGNDVRVLWMGDSSNLHRVWDSNMIDSKQLSYTELAQYLNRRATPALVKDWQSATPDRWLSEAMDLRPGVYDFPEDKRLGYQYAYREFPIVEEQLLKAGVRLAGILNEIYG